MKDIYVTFSGTELKGDSTDNGHIGAIEVSSFKHWVRQPKSSSSSSAGGHTAERTEHGEVLFTKDIDKATSKLFRASSAGTVYQNCKIEFYRAQGGSGPNTTTAGNQRINYYTIILENVVISSVSTEINEGELPAETFGLKYSKITWDYKGSFVTGVNGGQSTGIVGWDLKSNIAV